VVAHPKTPVTLSGDHSPVGSLYLVNRLKESPRETQKPSSKSILRYNMRIIGKEQGERFTIVPNEVLNADWPASIKITWMQLQSLYRINSDIYYHQGLRTCADRLQISYNYFQKSVKRLREFGACVKDDGDYRLLLPSEFECKSSKNKSCKQKQTSKDTEDLSIQKAVDSMPRRKPSGISQEESWKQIKEVWDKNRPEGYLIMKETIDKMAFIGIETQAKRLGITRHSYPQFVEQVLAGLKQDKWWPNQTKLRIGSVFGIGNKTAEKFLKVEAFYREGCKQLKPRFDPRNDQHWLNWYKSKNANFEEIQLITFETQQKFHDYFEDPEKPPRPESTAQIFFIESQEKPVTWTKHGQADFIYLPEFA
jgi:hypothetical protein